MSDKVNRGKDFEKAVRTGFEKVPCVSVDRIPDQMSGFAGSQNICDFIVYREPMLFYIECKCCYGNTLNYHAISDNQWRGLEQKSLIPGVIAGVMIWFIDHDETVFIPIQTLLERKRDGEKSVNAKTLNKWGMSIVRVPGKKRKILFDYDMEEFLNYIEWLETNDPFYSNQEGYDEL